MGLIESTLALTIDYMVTTALVVSAPVGLWRLLSALGCLYSGLSSTAKKVAPTLISLAALLVLVYTPTSVLRPPRSVVLVAASSAAIACTILGLRFLRDLLGVWMARRGAEAPVLGRAVFGIASLGIFDGLFLGQGWLSLLAVPILIFVQLVRAAIDRSRETTRPRARQRVAAAALWLIAGVGTLGVARFNAVLARHRAEDIIAACRDYERDHRQLPSTLQTLVPYYLPAVPRARLAPVNGKFIYRAPRVPRGALLVSYSPVKGAEGPVHTLQYVTALGLVTYVFERNRWVGFGERSFASAQGLVLGSDLPGPLPPAKAPLPGDQS